MAPPNVPICSRSTDLGRPRRTDSPARSPSADDLQEEPMLFDDPSSSSPTIGDARPARDDPQLHAGRGLTTSDPWARADAQRSPDPRLIEDAEVQRSRDPRLIEDAEVQRSRDPRLI